MSAVPPPGHQPASHRRRPRILRAVVLVLLSAGALTLLVVVSVTLLNRPSSPDPESSTVTVVEEAASNTTAEDAPTAGNAAETTAEKDVANSGSVASDGPDFSADSSIQVTEVTPSVGSTIGGEAVVITGAGFREGLRVLVGDRESPDVKVLNDSKLRVILPAGLAGDATIEVGSAIDVPVRVDGIFTYVDQPPRVVMAIRPSSGPRAGGTTVSIVGTGFASGAKVVIGGQPATDVTVLDSTRISAVTAEGAEGFVDVIVRNPGMPAAILPGAYEYLRAPTLWGVEPFEISYEGGQTVTVTGTGFEPGIQVGFNGVGGRDVTLVDDRRLTVVTPPGIPGPVTVAVVNPGQPLASLDDAAFYIVPPDPIPEPVSSPTEAENPDSAVPPVDPAAEAPAPEEGAPAAG